VNGRVRRSPPLERRLLEAVRRAGEAHGRALAHELGADSGAIARCLRRLEARGLLTSRWVGRTRLYQATAAARPDADPLLDEVVRRLRTVPGLHPIMVLPFGSRARGRAGPGSDVDVIVVLPDREYTLHGYQLLSAAVRDVGVPVDLLPFPLAEARRWAEMPANPLRAAIDLWPEAKAALATSA
jgi:predicted nucleotidyltransferase